MCPYYKNHNLVKTEQFSFLCKFVNANYAVTTLLTALDMSDACIRTFAEDKVNGGILAMIESLDELREDFLKGTLTRAAAKFLWCTIEHYRVNGYQWCSLTANVTKGAICMLLPEPIEKIMRCWVPNINACIRILLFFFSLNISFNALIFGWCWTFPCTTYLLSSLMTAYLYCRKNFPPTPQSHQNTN